MVAEKVLESPDPRFANPKDPPFLSAGEESQRKRDGDYTAGFAMGLEGLGGVSAPRFEATTLLGKIPVII